jgi:hypothetical protein
MALNLDSCAFFWRLGKTLRVFLNRAWCIIGNFVIDGSFFPLFENRRMFDDARFKHAFGVPEPPPRAEPQSFAHPSGVRK